MAQTYDYIGKELKYAVEITAPGFSIEEDNFKIVLQCGKTQVELTRPDVIISEDGVRYIAIDTTWFPKGGTLYAITYAYVPDNDFPDGFRTEIDLQKLTTLKKLKDGMR